MLKLYDDGCTECAFDGVEAPTSPVTPSEIGGYTEYTVKAGDSLWAIADRSGDFRRWEELAKLNDIYEPFTIYVGQKIKIPKEWV